MTARDIEPCWRCGVKVDLVTDWRGRSIALELRPDPTRRPTFVEDPMGEFRPVYRLVCLPAPPAPPNDGRELLRPIAEARAPPKPARSMTPQPQMELFK
jgi:hypothetical protein